MANFKQRILTQKGLPSAIVLLVCLIYAGILLATDEGNPHALIDYDGYHSYDIANEFLAVPFSDHLDNPAYRMQRILYPLTARLLALGNPVLIPWMLILINLFAIVMGTWLIELLLTHLDVSHWYALAYGLYGGQLMGLRTSINEPFVHMLLVAAMWAWTQNKRGWAIVWFSLALLSKETAVLFIAAYILHTLLTRDWRWAIGLSTSMIPWAVWQIGLWLWLGQTGFSATAGFIWIPFGGWLRILRYDLLTFLLISLMIVPMSVIPTLIGIYLSLRRLLQGDFHPFVLSLLLNAVFILFLPYPTFRESSAMIRITQGLALSMLLFGGLVKSSRILNYSLLWIFTNALHVKGSGRLISQRVGN